MLEIVICIALAWLFASVGLALWLGPLLKDRNEGGSS
jgi:hypothetical protein